MPISEDEFDCKIIEEPSTMSKAELRKTHKPIMEKRRRARINHCLNEIKTLILEAMNKDPARHSKLEKADILEMAVKHLQNTQRQQLAMAMTTDPSIVRKFKSGFNECTQEIERYISQIEGVDAGMKQRIISHLQKCIGGIEQVAQFNFPGFNNLSFLSANNLFGQKLAEAAANIGDQNNNPRIHIPQGIQLIPSRLPSGELALLVPNSSNLPLFPMSAPNRPSAFASVIPHSSNETVSKPLSPPASPPGEDPRGSPRGFRPVYPSKTRGEDHQVPQISSTVSFSDSHKFVAPLEVKPMRFPMNKLEKDRGTAMSPKKPAEPLCIITNQNERYKQAQMKPDSAFYEENLYQGVKRKFGDSGLLTIASQEMNRAKVQKSFLGATPSSGVKVKVETQTSGEMEREALNNRNEMNLNRDGNEDGGNDMWRPW